MRLRLVLSSVLAVLVLALCAPVVRAAVLPKPDFSNSFCLFPIDEKWHANAGNQDQLKQVVQDIRDTLGGGRLYDHLGIAIISSGYEPETFKLARDLGIGLVLQGGAGDHHSQSWGFPKLLQDPNTGDRRFAQWFQDGSYCEPGKENDFSFGVRACMSVYARPVFELREKSEHERSQRLARAFREFPNTVLAVSGPIEDELGQGKNLWGDYSPYTLAEFRDYLIHRGVYANGAARSGMGYPGGEVFSNDPAPNVSQGAHSSFNQTFGTTFATWSLRYWDPEKFPQRLPLDANGMPGAGQVGFIPGGFDAPRVWPGQKGTAAIPAEGNSRFWDAWASVSDALPGFREKIINFWLRDQTRWLAEAGIGRDHIFTHQIPGESYGMGRLSQGASAVWTADTPHGSIGITTYFGAASDTAEFQKIVDRNRNWGIFEYHPHPIGSLSAPVSEYLHSLWTCIRFRAHILTPISWTDKGKDFIVTTGPFPEAIKQVMTSLPDQPYYNRSYVNYSPPDVTDLKSTTAAGATSVSWSPLIWPDRRYEWTDWREFVQFQVKGQDGKLLASTRDDHVTLAGAPPGITVVAIKRVLNPPLPAVTGLTGYKGKLHWDDVDNFFADHYEVETSTGGNTDHTLNSREASITLRSMGKQRQASVRAAVSDGNGRTGPMTPWLRVSLPLPGRLLYALRDLHPRVLNSPDTNWKEEDIGGITQSGLFEHPPLTGGGWATATYPLVFPPVKPGQRIVLTSEVGIAGVGPSDGVNFGVNAGKQGLYQKLIAADKKWHPIEVDLTQLAGKHIALVLRTNMNQNSAGDWATWADPEVVLTGKGVVERPTVEGIVARGKEVRGQVTLTWDNRASDGSLWNSMAGLVGFRVYRGADRGFQPGPANRLGETKTREFVDRKFEGNETYYRVTAYFADGAESPPSEAIQYAP